MNLFIIIFSGVLVSILLYLIFKSDIDSDLDLEKNKHERFFRREINRK